MKPPAEVWKLTRKAANQVDSANTAAGVAPISKDVESFFGQALTSSSGATGVVHEIWPAQAGAQQFGWRPRRSGRDVETRITADKTCADMTDLIGRAAHVIQSWNNLHGAGTTCTAPSTMHRRGLRPPSCRRQAGRVGRARIGAAKAGGHAVQFSRDMLRGRGEAPRRLL